MLRSVVCIPSLGWWFFWGGFKTGAWLRFSPKPPDGWAPSLLNFLILNRSRFIPKQDFDCVKPVANTETAMALSICSRTHPPLFSKHSTEGPGRIVHCSAEQPTKSGVRMICARVWVALPHRQHFQPYLETSFEKLSDLLQYFHEGVRGQAALVWRNLQPDWGW